MADSLTVFVRQADILWRLGQRDGARRAYELACSTAPSSATEPLTIADRGRLRARYGDLETGFAEILASYPRDRRTPMWDGGAVPRGQSLLLFQDGGYGDVLWMSRYLERAAERTSRVVLFVHRPLQRLLRASVPSAVIVAEPGGIARPGAFAPLRGLPAILGVMREPTPLVVGDSPRLPWDGRSLRVGIAWSGNATHEHEHERSCPVSALAPLLEMPDVTFYCVQRNARDAESYAAGAVRLDGLVRDFADTAALMAQMDCVVTTDSAPLHLAGAVGVPTLALLACGPEWPWMDGEGRSPWYPSVRMLRQPRPGGWNDVATRAAAMLAARDLPPRMGLALARAAVGSPPILTVEP